MLFWASSLKQTGITPQSLPRWLFWRSQVASSKTEFGPVNKELDGDEEQGLNFWSEKASAMSKPEIASLQCQITDLEIELARLESRVKAELGAATERLHIKEAN